MLFWRGDSHGGIEEPVGKEREERVGDAPALDDDVDGVAGLPAPSKDSSVRSVKKEAWVAAVAADGGGRAAVAAGRGFEALLAYPLRPLRWKSTETEQKVAMSRLISQPGVFVRPSLRISSMRGDAIC